MIIINLNNYNVVIKNNICSINNKDTELTKIYYDYYSKSQEILNNMKNYKQQETTVLSA